MIKAGTGISLLPEQDIRPDEAESLVIWKTERLTLTLSIACLNRRRDEPVLQALFSVLSRVWET
jgi:DNA-binding transcriptional LysR family regulator